MLTLLLGPDDFSKIEYIHHTSKTAEMLSFYLGDSLPMVERLGERDLFSQPKTFVLHGVLSAYEFSDAHLVLLSTSPNQIFLSKKS